jgi:hypothetical protein
MNTTTCVSSSNAVCTSITFTAHPLQAAFQSVVLQPIAAVSLCRHPEQRFAFLSHWHSVQTLAPSLAQAMHQACSEQPLPWEGQSLATCKIQDVCSVPRVPAPATRCPCTAFRLWCGRRAPPASASCLPRAAAPCCAQRARWAGQCSGAQQ